MPIPKYDEMMLPMLRVLQDGSDHPQRELAELVADLFKISPEERARTLPSSSRTYVRHRVAWAGFGLRRAGLADMPRTGSLRITDEGREFLSTNPAQLRAADLKQFPPYVAFLKRTKSSSEAGPRSDTDVQVSTHETPEERMETAHLELKETLVGDLREKLSVIDPFRFEQVVLDLLVAMGYGGSRKEAASGTQKTGDEGIDGVINEDRLGLDVIYIQAKRWKQNIGRPEIQSFVGALSSKKANKGVFISTGDFHANARECARDVQQKIILIDGRRLAELMIEHNIGVAEEHAYRVKKIDSDYFDEA